MATAAQIASDLRPDKKAKTAFLVGELKKIVPFAPDADRNRFANSIAADLNAFAKASEELHDGQIGDAIENLFRAATAASERDDPDLYQRVAFAIETLHDCVRSFLTVRARGGLRFPPVNEFKREETRRKANHELVALLQMGGCWKQGRNRPNRKRSRPYFVPTLWKPTSIGPGRKSKKAEEWFVCCLSITYLEATGREPPFVVHQYSRSPFFYFVAKCFEAAGVRTADSSAVRAINIMGAKRKAAASFQRDDAKLAPI